MSRIRSNALHLEYKFPNETDKLDIQTTLVNLGVEQYIISQGEDTTEYKCLVYSAKRWDLLTFRRFKVNGVVPAGKAVKSEDMQENIKELVAMDINYVSVGFKMPLSARLVQKALDSPLELSALERELLQLREENSKLKEQNKKLKKKLSTNITYNTIINFNTLFDVKVNDFGNENLALLTREEKTQILEEKMDTSIALKCIEKVHFNPRLKENNNVFMTNIRNEKLIVRAGGKWDVESDYYRTFMNMTHQVPRHLRIILEDQELPVHNRVKARISKIADEGLENDDEVRVYRKLPDLAYSYTKSLTDIRELLEDEE
jgi:hypothetical protein